MSGRSIIVTGGFGALGRVVASAFARQGDKVARIDFAPTAPDAAEGVFDLPGVDLTDAAAVAVAAASVAERQGGIDVLVNIAGGFTWETLDGGSIAAWERMFAMNVVSTTTMTKAALPFLIAAQAGRIINMGAGGAVQAAAGMGAYAASKAGVHRLTEALAANRADMPDADFSAWVQPGAIADVILFLSSPAARSISGALIPVTRGQPE
jgi:NAD(P)-dependent dehydrogenase (short-subunit alcohol dehydrogenase family)